MSSEIYVIDGNVHLYLSQPHISQDYCPKYLSKSLQEYLSFFIREYNKSWVDSRNAFSNPIVRSGACAGVISAIINEHELHYMRTNTSSDNDIRTFANEPIVLASDYYNLFINHGAFNPKISFPHTTSSRNIIDIDQTCRKVLGFVKRALRILPPQPPFPIDLI